MNYTVIYADPPWPYNDQMKGHPMSLDHEYPTQSIEWIASLPVSKLAARDSVLLLWVTSPHMPNGLQVMESWGFKYKTVGFCWVKIKQDGKSICTTLGRWTRGSIELCLLGVKGAPNKMRINKSIRQVVLAKRRGHSKKPTEIRKRIVDLFGDQKRIELFSRERVDGWDCFGNEGCENVVLKGGIWQNTETGETS